MVLFYAVKAGPAYLIFPLISLSPVITIVLSLLFLHERTGRMGVLGIVLAVCALPLFDFNPGGAPQQYGLWFVLAIGVLVAWGLQAYFIKLANTRMDAESIFFYMTASALLCIPVALAMTDFSQPINYGPSGPLLAAGLWEDTSHLLPDGNLGTFTIITGDSSGVSADIHDRMPVWLQAGQIDEWMTASPDDAMAMLLASETPAMEAYRVSRAVNTPRNNREDLLQQIA